MSKKAIKIIDAYERTFNSPSGKMVLKDLQESFCGSCFDPNPAIMAWKEGAREVVLKIEGLSNPGANRIIIEQLSKTKEGI